MNIDLNETWLHGSYFCGEINTTIGYVSITDCDDDFFAQGDDAWQIISEIHHIWLNSDITNEQAFQRWICFNL